MSEPTTLYILITPVLKANKVLGRIETFRLAQPLGPSRWKIPRNWCTANECRNEKAENRHTSGSRPAVCLSDIFSESLSVHLASRAHTHHPLNNIPLSLINRFVSDLPLSTLVLTPMYNIFKRWSFRASITLLQLVNLVASLRDPRGLFCGNRVRFGNL